ncbi:MAG: hypothetical protein H0W29_16345, partial [Gemmatimonadales bacterium]|nr:hypothetical protein [Gemmatimonadales bacterium]
MRASLVRAAAAAGLAAVLAAPRLPAQEEGAAAEAARLRETVSFDVVRLYGVGGKTLVEIYSRIPTQVLTFTEAEGRWAAGLAFELTVRRGDEVVLEDSWTRTKTVADRRMLDSSRLFFVETHAFLIAPGTYELEGAITDAAGKELGALRRTLEAPEENPPVSDLLLVARIEADTAAQAPEAYDPVRKNQLVLNPNPGQVYSTAVSPLVYFYVEFENAGSEPLALQRVLRFQPKGSDQVVKEVRATKAYQPGWTIDFGAVNVAGLKAGPYTLEALWEAPEGGELPEEYRGLTRMQDFTFLREARTPAEPRMARAETPGAGELEPEGGAAPAGPIVDYYAGYSEAELDSVFRMLGVLFERSEKSVYEGLTPEGKQGFLNRFWA